MLMMHPISLDEQPVVSQRAGHLVFFFISSANRWRFQALGRKRVEYGRWSQDLSLCDE